MTPLVQVVLYLHLFLLSFPSVDWIRNAPLSVSWHFGTFTILADILSSSSYALAMSSYLPHVTHLFIASTFHPATLPFPAPFAVFGYPLPCFAKRFPPRWLPEGIKRWCPPLSTSSQHCCAPSFHPRSPFLHSCQSSQLIRSHSSPCA
jgi:hypothetical protein